MVILSHKKIPIQGGSSPTLIFAGVSQFWQTLRQIYFYNSSPPNDGQVWANFNSQLLNHRLSTYENIKYDSFASEHNFGVASFFAHYSTESICFIVQKPLYNPPTNSHYSHAAKFESIRMHLVMVTLHLLAEQK